MEIASISTFVDPVPPIVMRFSIKTKKYVCCQRDQQKQKNTVNQVLKVLKDDGFILRVIKSVYNNVYLVTVDLGIDDLCHEAELLKLTVRLEDKN